MARYIKSKWGSHLTLLDRKRFKVKILHFNAMYSCSLQRHEKRSELWLFLSGSGSFLKMKEGRKTRDAIVAGDYALVDKHEFHRFTAEQSTWVLEVQFGDKCDEEDITRI